jgi:hypothetical protein
MTNLTPSSVLSNVPEIETNTALLGGPGGPLNAQAQALLNRTQWLGDNMAISSNYSSTASGEGANLIGYKLTDTYSVARTSQTKHDDIASFKDFGGIGDNSTDNATAFANAESSSYSYIYLPKGTYYTTSPFSTLHKHYHGPGQIRTSAGDFMPGRAQWITTSPYSGSGTSYAKYFSSDLSGVDSAYKVFAGNRTSLTGTYFGPETSLELSVYDNRAGCSGTDARLTVAASVGNTIITVNSTAGFNVGDTIGFDNGSDVITDVSTVTALTGTTLTLNAGIANAYAVGYHITHGVRTMQSLHHMELQHRGAGDAYINLMRVEASYSGTAGQDHVFFRSTAGMDGGDIVADTSGVYLTGREISFLDQGNDIAVLADIRTFMRTNNTGADQAFWHGITLNSAGTVPCNAAYIAAGEWQAILDSSRADTSSNGGCVVNMALDQYLYWGSTGSASQLYESWGRNRGPHRLGYNSGNAEIDVTVNSVIAFGVGQFNVTTYVNHKFVGSVGFNNTAPIAKPTVTGSKGGNAALASLITALANYGLIVDSTT